MLNVKRNFKATLPEQKLLFELPHCTNFDINLFAKNLEKLINATANWLFNYSETFQYLPISNHQWHLQIADKKQTSRMIYYEIFLKKPFGSSL